MNTFVIYKVNAFYRAERHEVNSGVLATSLVCSVTTRTHSREPPACQTTPWNSCSLDLLSIGSRKLPGRCVETPALSRSLALDRYNRRTESGKNPNDGIWSSCRSSLQHLGPHAPMCTVVTVHMLAFCSQLKSSPVSNAKIRLFTSPHLPLQLVGAKSKHSSSSLLFRSGSILPVLNTARCLLTQLPSGASRL
jgi:hypothetical protein